VAGIADGVRPGEGAGTLDDPGDRVGVEPPAGFHGAMAVDLAKDWALGYPRQGQPGVERAHRAGVRMRTVGDGGHGTGPLLIGLAVVQGELEAVGRLGDVGHIQGDELGAAEAAAAADEEQGPVTSSRQRLGMLLTGSD
jgi:hypothetical protein